jgi:tetratricopeptide (TPR) repeat protein/GT2 family glycosyltransferase
MVANRIFKKYGKTEAIISLCQTQDFAPTPPQIDAIVLGNVREKSFMLINPNETVDRVKDMGSFTETNLDRARYYFSQKDWERTIVACQDALNASPKLAEAYKIWGNALQKQGKISEGIGYYAKALEIQPDMPEIYVNLGSIYAQKKQWQKAVDYFQQAIKFNPDFDGAYHNLSRVWKELGDPEKATEANYRAYCIAPQKATAEEHYLLGRQLLSQQRLDEALECYRRAISQKPDWLEVYEHLANLLEKLGQWEEAVSHRRQIIVLQREQGLTSTTSRAIVTSQSTPKPNVDIIQFYLEQLQENPDSAEINAILGSLFEQRQKWKEAIVFYRQSLKLNPQQPQVYYKTAQSLLKVGREDIAADCWYRALTLMGKQAEPTDYLRLGNLQQKLNQIDAASLCYRRALRLQPTLTEAYDRLAEICLQQGKIEATIAIYQTGLKYNPQNSRIYYNLGKIFASNNNWQAAIDCYQKALAIDANLWQIQHELGDAFSQQKSWQDAATAYRRAIELKADFFWSYNNLGYTLLHLQAPTEAIEVLQKALQLKQDFHWTYENLGTAYLSLQCWNEAAAAYRRVLKLQPQSSQATEKLNYILKQKAAADSNLAFELYLEAIARDPDDIDNYHQALEIYGDRPELYLGLADAHNRREEWASALANYERACELQPNDLTILTKLNLIHNRLERFQSNTRKQIPIEEIIETAEETLAKNNLALINITLDKSLEDRNTPEKLIELEVENATEINYLPKPLTPMIPMLSTDKLQFCLSPITETIETDKTSFLHSVEVTNNEGNRYLLAANNTAIEIEDEMEIVPATKLNDLLTPLMPQASETVFSLLQVYNDYPQLGAIDTLAQLCRHAGSYLPNSNLQIDRAYWLAPSIVYIEAFVEDIWLSGDLRIFVTTEDCWAMGMGRAFQIEDRKLVIFAIFPEEVYTAPHTAYSLIVDMMGEAKLRIDGEIFAKAYSLEFLEFFNQKPEHQKHLIRESISKTILDRNVTDSACRADCANLLQKLQYFVRVELAYPNNPSVPFQIFFDHIIPIKRDGLFISGWLQNPYDLLESIEVISDLGFSLLIDKKDIHKFDRQDVSEHLKSTPYGNFAGKHGFCTYVAVPEATRQSMMGLAELHSFRFRLHLKGRIYLEYVPGIQYQDVHSARQTIVHIAPPDTIDEAMLKGCIAPAAAKLQQYCIETVAIREVENFGKPIPKPLISIIIPLYKCLDFLKVQFATMANDSSLRSNCELIYVLDSPEQEREVKNFLQHYCLLYQLPATLVIMARNSGYAAANNFGATQARGKYLILLNSDVFPKQEGWAVKMAKFYAEHPQIGALAPKLLYEDDSLQHAGMYFEKTTFPFWLTLHYYKGFPHSYANACFNRAVPAVTGACLLVAKDLFDRVGGLTTDYVIGDFEDSDFCFKCTSLGYESWYFADAELYHLERQSVPLNDVYAHSLAWQYNARLHESRWGNLITGLQGA